MFTEEEINEMFNKMSKQTVGLPYPLQFRKVQHQTLQKHCDKLLEIEGVRGFHIFPWVTMKKEETSFPMLFYRCNECAKASVILAFGGYYNTANALLRTILELSCLIVYFKDHKVEYSWWAEGRKDALTTKSYSDLVENYIFKLHEFQIFVKKKGDGKEENLLKNDIKSLYSVLSHIIHGQQWNDKNILLMDYDEGLFLQWYNNFINLTHLFNILTLVTFGKVFEKDSCTMIISTLPKKYQKILENYKPD